MSSQLKKLISELNPENLNILPRLISLVENQPDNNSILESIPNRNIPVIGITGPPGAGKSTLLSRIIQHLRGMGKRIAVLAVDPSSSFSKGSVLGDRIRMQNHALDSDVFIRSLANRGYLGGLSAASSDILAIVQAFAFDYIFLETVGVGQSEIEVASMASCVVVVLVPESGDEIQSIKSGLLEIADILVVNKSDREGAGKLLGILRTMLHEKNDQDRTGLVKTIAETGEGISELWEEILKQISGSTKEKQMERLLERVYHLVARKRMESFNKDQVYNQLKTRMVEPGFNLYSFIGEIESGKPKPNL